MKAYLKKLTMIAAMLAATMLPSLGASAASTITATSSELVAGANGVITLLSVANSATNSCVITLFDAPATNLTYTVGAYTNATVTSQSTIVTNINILGNTNYSTNTTITTTLSPVSASTNSYPKLLTYTVPASTTTTLPLSPGLFFSRGVMLTNAATNVTVTVVYQTTR